MSKIQEKKLNEIVETNKQIELDQKAHAETFESELAIYYHKKEEAKLSYNKHNDFNNESDVESEKNETDSKKELLESPDLVTSNTEQSPTLPRKVMNPFLKKRLSKFGSTEMKKDVVVRSKYFHSQSVDSATVEQKANDNNFIETIETENIKENSRKRKTEPEENSTIIDESPVKDIETSEEKNRQSLSQASSQVLSKLKMLKLFLFLASCKFSQKIQIVKVQICRFTSNVQKRTAHFTGFFLKHEFEEKIVVDVFVISCTYKFVL